MPVLGENEKEILFQKIIAAIEKLEIPGLFLTAVQNYSETAADDEMFAVISLGVMLNVQQFLLGTQT
jgi:hypothetical protein